MENPIQSAGEAMPVTNSLQTCIYRYRADWNAYLADSAAMEERGEPSNVPHAYEPAMRQLETWARPAESLVEAMMALELAVEDYNSGDTPIVPAMMNAALGWMRSEQGRGLAERLQKDIDGHMASPYRNGGHATC